MSAEFIAFARAHGVEIDPARLDDSGKLRRCATTEHPRARNGAYVFDGQGGFVWAWDGEARAVSFKTREERATDTQAMARHLQRRQRLQHERRELAAKAVAKAQALIDASAPQHHDYLARKGFPAHKGLVTPDGELVIPMRELRTGRLLGAQVIRWLPDERRFEKKYLYGMTSKGAALRLGSSQAPLSILVEGMATGLSVEAAVRQMCLRASVIVTFSASNLVHVASLLGGERCVIADNDPPQRDPEKARLNPGSTGQRAAAATGLPWACPETEGWDANDEHAAKGLVAVTRLVMLARKGA